MGAARGSATMAGMADLTPNIPDRVDSGRCADRGARRLRGAVVDRRNTSCMRLYLRAGTAEQIADRAGAIIVGTPISVREDATGSRSVVRVSRSYKRRMPQIITIVSASPAGACGSP